MAFFVCTSKWMFTVPVWLFSNGSACTQAKLKTKTEIRLVMLIEGRHRDLLSRQLFPTASNRLKLQCFRSPV